MKYLIAGIFPRLLSGILAKPIQIMLLAIACCCVLGAGLGGLTLNASYSAYFDVEDPILQQHRELQSKFSSTDGLLVVVEFGKSSALDPDAIKLLDTLSRDLASLEIVSKVTSILGLNLGGDSGFDEMDAEFFSLDAETEPTIVSRSIDRKTIKNDPRSEGLLLSNDETALALDIELDLPEGVPAPKLLQALAEIRAVAEKLALSSDLEPIVRFSGPLALNEAYISVIRHDLKVFLPMLVLSMGIVLTLVFGSLKLTCIALTVGLFSIVSAFGAAGWLNFELAAINAFAPVIIASIALAGTVHILNSYYLSLAEGREHDDAITLAITDNIFPLALTTLTTAAGFLALSYSPSPPIRTIGFIVAIGVSFAGIFNLLLFPALLKCTSARPARARWMISLGEGICRATERFPKTILIVSGILAVCAIPLAAQNQINDNVFEYFPKTHQFKQDLEVLNSKFSGINPQIFSVTTSKAFGALNIEFLNALDTFQNWLESQPEVNKALSITDFPAVQAQLSNPNSGELARYKALANLHTPHGLGVEKLLDEDYQTVAVHAYVDSLDAKSLIDFDRRVKRRLMKAFPELITTSGGTSLVFAHLGQRNAASMVYALLAALLAISVICIFILRSWHGAWIGILCNLLPVFIVYALWALIDGKISIGGAVVIGMILGIVVDDTLYMLTKFNRAINRGYKSPAITTVTRVGPALIITSVTIIIGLSSGLLSNFGPIRAMSGLSIGVILVAVLIDLFCLTVVLNWFEKHRRIKR